MRTVRQGLRRGDVERDTYGRLVCSDCGTRLRTDVDPTTDDDGRACPDCGREWVELR